MNEKYTQTAKQFSSSYYGTGNDETDNAQKNSATERWQRDRHVPILTSQSIGDFQSGLSNRNHYKVY